MKSLFNLEDSTGFELLSENEMQEIRGGGGTRPVSRPKDIYDFEEE